MEKRRENLENLFLEDKNIDVKEQLTKLLKIIEKNQKLEIEILELFFTLLCLLDIKQNEIFAKNSILIIRKNKQVIEFLSNKILLNLDNKNINYLFLKLDVFSKKYFLLNFEK